MEAPCAAAITEALLTCDACGESKPGGHIPREVAGFYCDGCCPVCNDAGLSDEVRAALSNPEWLARREAIRATNRLQRAEAERKRAEQFREREDALEERRARAPGKLVGAAGKQTKAARDTSAMQDALRQKWADPEWRAMMLERMRASNAARRANGA